MKEPAVYDANIGNIQFPELCTDATTAADKVTCYSNSAGFLTLLAPSHNARTPSMTIAGGGYTNTFGGTSAAAPYTAGTIAALMSVDPKSNRPPAEYAQILRETGKPILDGKSGFTTPRIDLDAAYKMLTGQTQTATLSMGSASGTCGASVDVPVSISSVTGLTSLDFRVTFDASRLSVTQAVVGSLTTSWGGEIDDDRDGELQSRPLRLDSGQPRFRRSRRGYVQQRLCRDHLLAGRDLLRFGGRQLHRRRHLHLGDPLLSR
jgi:subtilisin family serine protease